MEKVLEIHLKTAEAYFRRFDEECEIKLYNAQEHSIADIEDMTGVKKAKLYRALKQRVD